MSSQVGKVILKPANYIIQHPNYENYFLELINQELYWTENKAYAISFDFENDANKFITKYSGTIITTKFQQKDDNAL